MYFNVKDGRENPKKDLCGFRSHWSYLTQAMERFSSLLYSTM